MSIETVSDARVRACAAEQLPSLHDGRQLHDGKQSDRTLAVGGGACGSRT